jgi:hypothetical protein
VYARAHLPGRDANAIRNTIMRLKEQHGIADRRRIKLEPPPEPEQTQLAI